MVFFSKTWTVNYNNTGNYTQFQPYHQFVGTFCNDHAFVLPMRQNIEVMDNTVSLITYNMVEKNEVELRMDHMSIPLPRFGRNLNQLVTSTFHYSNDIKTVLCNGGCSILNYTSAYNSIDWLQILFYHDYRNIGIDEIEIQYRPSWQHSDKQQYFFIKSYHIGCSHRVEIYVCQFPCIGNRSYFVLKEEEFLLVPSPGNVYLQVHTNDCYSSSTALRVAYTRQTRPHIPTSSLIKKPLQTENKAPQVGQDVITTMASFRDTLTATLESSRLASFTFTAIGVTYITHFEIDMEAIRSDYETSSYDLVIKTTIANKGEETEYSFGDVQQQIKYATVSEETILLFTFHKVVTLNINVRYTSEILYHKVNECPYHFYKTGKNTGDVYGNIPIADAQMTCAKSHTVSYSPYLSWTCKTNFSIPLSSPGEIYRDGKFLMYEYYDKTLYEVEQTQFITIKLYKSLVLSSAQAKAYCESINMTLLQAPSLELFVSVMGNIDTPDIEIEMFFINLNKTNLIDELFNVSENCQNIRLMKSFVQRTEFLYNSPSVKVERSKIFKEVVAQNEQIFCLMDTNTRQLLLNHKDKCIAIHYQHFCSCPTVMLIPCSFQFENVAFLCMDMNTTLNKDPKTNNTIPIPYKVEYFNYHRLNNISKSDDLFECADLTYISDFYVCNGIDDCPSGNDESNCTDICIYDGDSEPSGSTCFTDCSEETCSCMHQYYQCRSGGCVAASTICDCIPDCKDGSDEMMDLCSHFSCKWELPKNYQHHTQMSPMSAFRCYGITGRIEFMFYENVSRREKLCFLKFEQSFNLSRFVLHLSHIIK